MLFQDSTFRTLEASKNTAWLRSQVHAHNIANFETPRFKAKRVVFGEVLSRERGPDGERSARLQAQVIRDTTTTIRPDGNNVELDSESLNLYRTYVHHAMLLDRLSGRINMIQYVANNAPS